ncbi:energy transducer TonB [Thaumasiovibrio subtropicus]|uniref:energy transducer TonB n=1 Tax=Thaumasiovibrio subtropicus TaxID=1891207 RepID=UPI000B35430C|nr:energy transducer TonB [Thaumasiovibrio subtropicus]
MKRLLMALPIAVISTLGLFTFMAWMVNPVQNSTAERRAPLSFNMVMLEKEEAIQRRQRTVPKQPDLPEPPPEAKPTTTQQVAVSLNAAPVTPTLNLTTAISGINVSVPSFGKVGVIASTNNQQVMPLHRVNPNYPAKAQRQGIEGKVVLSFTIDEQGRPTDIKVVSATPKRIFEREAMRALRRWKYQPQIIDGVAVAQPGKTVTIEFRMPK